MWAVPFDPADPVGTPNTLGAADEEGQALIQGLRERIGARIAAVDWGGLVGGEVAFAERMPPLRFLGPQGGSTTDAIEAIAYAVDHGALVLNNSWGGGGYEGDLATAIADGDEATLRTAARAMADFPGLPHRLQLHQRHREGRFSTIRGPDGSGGGQAGD